MKKTLELVRITLVWVTGKHSTLMNMIFEGQRQDCETITSHMKYIPLGWLCTPYFLQIWWKIICQMKRKWNFMLIVNNRHKCDNKTP